MTPKNLLLQKLTFSLQIAREFRIFNGVFFLFSMIFLCQLIYGEVLLGNICGMYMLQLV